MYLRFDVLCQNQLLGGDENEIRVMCDPKPFAEGRDGRIFMCTLEGENGRFVAKEYYGATYEKYKDHPFEIASELQGLQCTDSRYILAVDGETYYFIFPYLGKDLRQVRKQGPAYAGLGLAQFLCLLKSVWDTVKALNEKGIMHGDIKDNNVVVNDDCNKMFLIDFSLCTKTTDNHCTKPGPWMQLSIEAQWELPRGIKDDVRAFLVLVVDLILQGKCYCSIQVKKGEDVYEFASLKENLEDKLKTKLDAWPTLQTAILQAYCTVRAYDQASLHLIQNATDEDEVCDHLRTLGDTYLPALKVCAENVISHSQDAVAKSQHTKGV